MDKEQQIEEIMLTIPQKIVAYNGDPKGQHLYGEQRLQIAEVLYNAGYRKVPRGCGLVKTNAVKEFARKVKKCSYCDNDFMDGKWHRYVFVDDIDKLLKEYEK